MPDTLKLLGLHLSQHLGATDQLSSDKIDWFKGKLNEISGDSSIDQAINMIEDMHQIFGDYLVRAKSIENDTMTHSSRCVALKTIRDSLIQCRQEYRKRVDRITSPAFEDMKLAQLVTLQSAMVSYLDAQGLKVEKEIVSILYDNLLYLMIELSTQASSASVEDKENSDIDIAFVMAADVFSDMSLGFYGPLYFHANAANQQEVSIYQKVEEIKSLSDSVIRHPLFYRRCGDGFESFNAIIDGFLCAVEKAESKQKDEMIDCLDSDNKMPRDELPQNYITNLRNQLESTMSSQAAQQKEYNAAQEELDSCLMGGYDYYSQKLKKIDVIMKQLEKQIVSCKKQIAFHEKYFNLSGQCSYFKKIIDAQREKHHLFNQKQPETNLELLCSMHNVQALECRLIRLFDGTIQWIQDGASFVLGDEYSLLAHQAHERIPEDQQQFIYNVIYYLVFDRGVIPAEKDLKYLINGLNVRLDLKASEKLDIIYEYLKPATIDQAPEITWLGVITRRIDQMNQLGFCMTDLDMPQLQILLDQQEVRRCLGDLTDRITKDNIKFLLTFLSKQDHYDYDEKQLNDQLVELLNHGILDGSILNELIFSLSPVEEYGLQRNLQAEQQNDLRGVFCRVFPLLWDSLHVLCSSCLGTTRKFDPSSLWSRERNLQFSKEFLRFMMDHVDHLSFFVKTVSENPVRQLIKLAEYDGQLLQCFHQLEKDLSLNLELVFCDFFTLLDKYSAADEKRYQQGHFGDSYSQGELVETVFSKCIQKHINYPTCEGSIKVADENAGSPGFVKPALELPSFEVPSFKVEDNSGLDLMLRNPVVLCQMIIFLFKSYPKEKSRIVNLKDKLKRGCSKALDRCLESDLRILERQNERESFVSFSLIMLYKQPDASIEDHLIRSLIRCAFRQPPEAAVYAASTASTSTAALDSVPVVSASASISSSPALALPFSPASSAIAASASFNEDLLRSLVELAINTYSGSGAPSTTSRLTRKSIRQLLKDGIVTLSNEEREELAKEVKPRVFSGNYFVGGSSDKVSDLVRIVDQAYAPVHAQPDDNCQNSQPASDGFLGQKKG